MIFSIWLTVVSICLLGAMSPGPSLALVLKHTLNGGRHQGMITGVAHGFAVGIYAILSVVGLAAVIHNLPWLFTTIQWAGAFFLAWIGFQGLRKKTVIVSTKVNDSDLSHAARDGFLMACLNPKAAIFFSALFSQIVGPETPLIAKLGYAFTAMVVDMSWYMTVAWLFSRSEEHTSELQSRPHLVCRLLLEKKK